MPATVVVPRLSVSVYLLKKIKAADAQRHLENAGEAIYPLVESIPGGALITLPADAEPPKWLGAILTLVSGDQTPQLSGQSPGALLWVPRGERTFVFAFGYGHSKVKDEWVEPDFGKIVALAIVPQGKVRELRAEQVFAKRHIANERAPTPSSVREFGFEPDRDLVAGVEGEPESTHLPIFGKKVRGGTSLKFDLDLLKLPETLDKIIERFESNDHQRRWPQANNLVPVRDDDYAAELDKLLDNILRGAHPDRSISLAAPAERSGDKPYPQHFTIGRMSDAPATSPYLTLSAWQGYLRKKGETLGLAAATSTPVHLLDEDKNEIESCSMYQCLGAEVSLNGVAHVLTSGTWYVAEIQFINSTNRTLSVLAPPSYSLARWNSIDHEGTYNAGICRDDPSLWLFDKELVCFGGGASRFEYCDIMHLPTRTLYFVKHPAGSAGVSHLCEQVRRTAETFFSTDPGYRTKLAARIAKLGRGWDTTWLDVHPKRHEWNLCLVLMGKRVSELPLFAKCGIARLLGELERGGYNVSFLAV